MYLHKLVHQRYIIFQKLYATETNKKNNKHPTINFVSFKVSFDGIQENYTPRSLLEQLYILFFWNNVNNLYLKYLHMFLW